MCFPTRSLTKRTIMKRNLRITIVLLLSTFIFIDAIQAQQDHFVYAITSLEKDGTSWTVLRKLNTQTGVFNTVFLNGIENSNALLDASSKKQVLDFSNDTISNSHPQMAFGSGVAAIAFNKEANRLYYVPTQVDQLRYIDLATMKVFCVTGQSFSKAGNLGFHLGSITRMVIAPDGYGYTITNDGNHFFRFSTNGNTAITDLGELVDAATNNETVHSECANAGGDLIADDNGSLYLITGSNRVFKIDINSKRTQFIGTISGLPQKFATSGAAVDEDGNLLLGSSLYSESYFLVDTKTWAASSYKAMNEMYNTADLASNNTIITKPSSFLKLSGDNFANKIKLYPNPVFADKFNIQFNNLKAGIYTIQLTDAVGNGAFQQKIKITDPSQTETINNPGRNAQGFYFLKILNDNNETIFTQIMVVER